MLPELRSELPAGCVARCRACQHRALSPTESHSRKLALLQRLLAPWASTIEPVRTAPMSWGYRDKTCLRAHWNGNRWELGIQVRERGMREPEFLAIPDCPVHSERVREVARLLPTLLPGPEKLNLAFVAISGSIATLVVKSRKWPELSGTDFSVLGLTGLFLNLNDSAGKRLFSNRGWKLLWGREWAARSFDGDLLEHGPSSFQQLIPELYRGALDEASRFLQAGPGDSVLDLCSGTGASLLRWKKAGARHLGVELAGEAVLCARKNVGSDGSVLQGRVSERIPQMEAWRTQVQSRLLAFANPPRPGLEQDVVRWIGETARPSRLAYLSCGPGTLARDLSDLTESGYAVRRIIPYDFFPRTRHIESLALLELDPGIRVSGASGARLADRADG